jgi:hypothetical protein
MRSRRFVGGDPNQTHTLWFEATSLLTFSSKHGGWENNEGAYGEFTFDVAQRTITLDYNERVETSEYSQHMF